MIDIPAKQLIRNIATPAAVLSGNGAASSHLLKYIAVLGGRQRTNEINSDNTITSAHA